VCVNENTENVEDLVLSQEDNPKTRRLNREISCETRVAVDMNFPIDRPIHIHIHRLCVDIHGYIHIHICLSCVQSAPPTKK